MAEQKTAFIARADKRTRRFARLKQELHLDNATLFARALRALAIREGVPVDERPPTEARVTRRPQRRRIADPPTPIASKRTQ